MILLSTATEYNDYVIYFINRVFYGEISNKYQQKIIVYKAGFTDTRADKTKNSKESISTVCQSTLIIYKIPTVVSKSKSFQPSIRDDQMEIVWLPLLSKTPLESCAESISRFASDDSSSSVSNA